MKASSNTLGHLQRISWSSIHTNSIPQLRKTLRSLGVAKVDLDDVAQDVLLASFTALDRFDMQRYARNHRSESREADPRALPHALDAGLAIDSDTVGSAHNPLDVIRAIAAGDTFGTEWDGNAASSAESSARETLAPPLPTKAWSPLGGWLFGIAWRQVSHYRHRAYRRREVLAGLLPPSSGHNNEEEAPAPDTLLAETERVTLIVQMLDRIDIERRVVLVLHDLLEMDVPQIAEELGLNRNTTQNRLRLARMDFQTLTRRLSEEKRQALMPESAEMVLPARQRLKRRRLKKP